MDTVDITIIGAGVIGLAIAQKLAGTEKDLLILEQHRSFGTETSSRHSEVIHAGIYYPKDSLKAKFCVAGKIAMYDYCRRNRIPFKQLGKLIVATKSEEEPILEEILGKARTNGVFDLQWMSRQELQRLEPELQATQALFSPSTGIIDSHSFMRSLLANAESKGANLVCLTPVERIEPVKEGFEVHVGGENPFHFHTRILINAGGLYAQDISRKISGLNPHSIPPIYFCKGNYFAISGKSPFSHLIYPVPEPNVAGLGVHSTIDLAGQVRFGPDVQYIDTIDYDVSLKNLPQFYHSIRRYFPGLPDASLRPDYSGIRPKLQGPGDPVADFIIQDASIHQLPGLIQLYGIESPGFTSSLAIADHVHTLL
ncbi:MAG: NAD(P)/FAD-dependent oxidoreductase [SAR324 cluster bacterium]|nr:NAD(P)/FAD-dependent oxidoreductase [SAR324 cluster bacterium]